MNKIIKFTISIIIPFIVAAIGGFFTSTSVSSWYLDLNKPGFNPPSWIFGPVWTILYFMMGVSLYLVWTKGFNKIAFIIFGIQLGLNLLWSILFFGLQIPMIAFIEIVILWVSILITIIYFYTIIPLSAYLLIPYLLWVSFAAILNFYIYILN